MISPHLYMQPTWEGERQGRSRRRRDWKERGTEGGEVQERKGTEGKERRGRGKRGRGTGRAGAAL
jgi:hypothetical protein